MATVGPGGLNLIHNAGGTPRFCCRLIPRRKFGRVPRHYIECSDDRVLLLAQQRAMPATLPCASAATLESDHFPFLTYPLDLRAAGDD